MSFGFLFAKLLTHLKKNVKIVKKTIFNATKTKTIRYISIQSYEKVIILRVSHLHLTKFRQSKIRITVKLEIKISSFFMLKI